MAQDYPIQRFHFQVDWGGAKISFTEVTGLDIEREIMEYRQSDKENLKKRERGIVKNNSLTFKRGKFEEDIDFKTWINNVSNERVNNRHDITIRLINEKNKPVAIWSVTRCFPVKFTSSDLKSDANEVAIESIEITHEGLEISEL